MRKHFEQQLSFHIKPISEVKIPTRSRDELPPVLAALQYVFVTPELNSQIFQILEDKIMKGKKKTGRTGMDLWEILVLATVRLTLDADYDRLLYTANFDILTRQIMGVHSSYGEGKSYGLQTLKDNMGLLDAETIDKINAIIVEHGQQFVLKKNEKLQIKSDTYVLETNVHFPTDYNLLWDSCRSAINMLKWIKKGYNLEGWRKTKDWHKKLKSAQRALGKATAVGAKKEEHIKAMAEEYLRLASELLAKLNSTYLEILLLPSVAEKVKRELKALKYYMEMIEKHIGLVKRRLINGEVIPTSEKIYSIFENHTEWLSKGKINKRVELGHKFLIATDQYNFIVYHKVIENQADVQLTIGVADALLQKYPSRIQSMSFDKGFYSKENKELLALEIPQVIMPKKGKLNLIEKEEEADKRFKKLRNKHSAVESNINQLEHNGLNRCPDKGLRNFKRYASIGILSYNLHKFGKLIREKAKVEPANQLQTAA